MEEEEGERIRVMTSVWTSVDECVVCALLLDVSIGCTYSGSTNGITPLKERT